tara:strand:- start:359 stop:1489 length:1131 start_codon:yes stop_codon:yes gene_type:complete
MNFLKKGQSKTWIIISLIFIAVIFVFVNYSSETVEDEGVYKLGTVQALTGEGAVYGEKIQRVIEAAVEDLNMQWEDKGMKLKIYPEDGKCNPKDALTAIQNLVNFKGVNVIYGGTCSGETLGMAPFAGDNEVIIFSTSSSSPEITNAGDFIFRDYPSDTAQVSAISHHIMQEGYENVAIMSENTDYAQALRQGYLDLFENVVADEIINPETKDVRTEMLKIKNANPNVVILLPQTIPMAGIFAKQWVETGMGVAGYGNEILSLGDTLKDYGTELEGFYTPRVKFAGEGNEAFQELIERTECDLDYFCATAYDGIFMLGEIFEKCGSEDTACIKDALYATQGWDGPIASGYSFDENGDVSGNFEILQIQDGELVVMA